MLIILHVIIAITSVVVASFSAFRPSIQLVTVSYSMVGLTLISGTALVIISSTNVIKACLTGLFYIAVVTGLSVLAHRKASLAKQGSESQ